MTKGKTSSKRMWLALATWAGVLLAAAELYGQRGGPERPQVLQSSFQVELGSTQTLTTADRARIPARRSAVLLAVGSYFQLDLLGVASERIETLRERLIVGGFSRNRVTVVSDRAQEERLKPYRANFERELARVLAAAEEDDFVLVAVCGRGVRLGGVSYLCPIEASPREIEARRTGRAQSDPKSLIPLAELIRTVARCRAQSKLLLLDVCYSAPLSDPASDEPAAGPADFFRALCCPDGVRLLGHCASGRDFPENLLSGPRPFLHRVLDGLRGEADQRLGNRNGRVSLAELDRFLVRETTSFVDANPGSRSVFATLGESVNCELVDLPHALAGTHLDPTAPAPDPHRFRSIPAAWRR